MSKENPYERLAELEVKVDKMDSELMSMRLQSREYMERLIAIEHGQRSLDIRIRTVWSWKRILLYLSIIGAVAGLLLSGTSITGGILMAGEEIVGTELFWNVVIGILFGLGTALTGIFKNKEKNAKTVIAVKTALPTVVITTIAGAYLGATGQEFSVTAIESAMVGFTAVGLNEWILNVAKGIYYAFKKK